MDELFALAEDGTHSYKTSALPPSLHPNIAKMINIIRSQYLANPTITLASFTPGTVDDITFNIVDLGQWEFGILLCGARVTGRRNASKLTIFATDVPPFHDSLRTSRMIDMYKYQHNNNRTRLEAAIDELIKLNQKKMSSTPFAKKIQYNTPQAMANSIPKMTSPQPNTRLFVLHNSGLNMFAINSPPPDLTSPDRISLLKQIDEEFSVKNKAGPVYPENWNIFVIGDYRVVLIANYAFWANGMLFCALMFTGSNLNTGKPPLEMFIFASDIQPFNAALCLSSMQEYCKFVYKLRERRIRPLISKLLTVYQGIKPKPRVALPPQLDIDDLLNRIPETCGSPPIVVQDNAIHVMQYNVCWECNVLSTGDNSIPNFTLAMQNPHAKNECYTPALNAKMSNKTSIPSCAKNMIKMLSVFPFAILSMQEVSQEFASAVTAEMNRKYPARSYTHEYKNDGLQKIAIIFDGRMLSQLAPSTMYSSILKITHPHFDTLRIAVAIKFRTIQSTPVDFLFISVHLDHQRNKDKLMKVLDHIVNAEGAHALPVVITGDMNMPFNRNTLGAYSVNNTIFTCCSYDGGPGGYTNGNYDQIMAKNVKAIKKISVAACNNLQNTPWSTVDANTCQQASDHRAVAAEIELA